MTSSADSGLLVHVNRAEGRPAPEHELRSAVEHTLRAEGVGDAELSLTLLDDAAMAELNQRYLERRGPTDVLAFPLGDADGGPHGATLGDVYLGRERAAAQAAEHDVPAREELLRLAVHGTLHVLGWDHPEGPERTDSAMFQRQEELLAQLLGALDSAAGS